MRCAPSAPPSALPPLDQEANDDETLDDDDVGGLIAPLDELPQPDDDDDLLTDPDFGIEAPSDPFANDRDTPLEIDIGSGFGLDTNESAPDADDAAGLEHSFGNSLDDDAEDSLPPDAEERDGLDDGRAGLEGLELPEIDADEHGTEREERFGELVTADETSIASAEHPWRAARLSPARERCGALAVAAGAAVAGSSDLLWLERGRTTPVRLALEGTRITSLALVGREHNVALCVTAFGRLHRRTRLGSDPERLHDWRRAAEAGTTLPDSLELRQLGPDEPRSVLGRVASGRLIRSDDEGTTFRVLDSAVSVRALSANGSPLVALHEGARTLGLSFDGGRSFETLELSSPAREIAGGDAPLLAGSGDTLAIADPARGLAVSNDGGRTFKLVPGAAGVTACTAGNLGRIAVIWAALYREAADASDLVLVNAATGEAAVVARLETPEEHDPEHALEASRLERLVWDGEQLFAVGGAGLVSFQPPLN